MAAAFSKCRSSEACCHLLRQTLDDRLRLALQEMAQVIDHLAVLGLLDGADAGSAAQLDIVIQAGARILAGDHPVAGEIGEDAPEHIQGLVHCPDAGVGAKIARAVLDHLAGDGHLGEGIRPVNFDIRVAFIILEADVVMRAVLLDQVHLEDERFELGTHHDPFDVGDILHQLAGLEILVGALLEIGTHPVVQVDGFADIDDLSLCVAIDVAARLGGQGIELLLEVLEISICWAGLYHAVGFITPSRSHPRAGRCRRRAPRLRGRAG